jgi:hypothetical protein
LAVSGCRDNADSDACAAVKSASLFDTPAAAAASSCPWHLISRTSAAAAAAAAAAAMCHVAFLDMCMSSATEEPSPVLHALLPCLALTAAPLLKLQFCVCLVLAAFESSMHDS